jgi:hypothetical protein
MKVFLVDDNLCAMHLQTGKHLVYGGRLLPLVEIAEKGKCEKI